MPVIHAVYENGVFKPREPVALPDACEVEFEPRVVHPTASVPPSATVTMPVRTGFPISPLAFVSDPDPTPAEFDALLDRMAARGTGQSLPADFSRADIYDDHD